MSYGPLAALVVSYEPHVLHAHEDIVRVVLSTARVLYGPERYIPGLQNTLTSPQQQRPTKQWLVVRGCYGEQRRRIDSFRTTSMDGTKFECINF